MMTRCTSWKITLDSIPTPPLSLVHLSVHLPIAKGEVTRKKCKGYIPSHSGKNAMFVCKGLICSITRAGYGLSCGRIFLLDTCNHLTRLIISNSLMKFTSSNTLLAQLCVHTSIHLESCISVWKWFRGFG
jgi:hypothetical protein